MVCLPALAATAYFIAVILLNLYNRNWNRIPGHALLGVFAVLLILYICERASQFVAWILLLAPFGFVVVGYLASVSFLSPKSEESDFDACSSCGQCPCCSHTPCLCNKPCWRPKPVCPKCPDSPKPEPEPEPEPKPKPDNCIKPSLDE